MTLLQDDAIVLNFYDDEGTGTPQDVVTVTAVWHHVCGRTETETFDITVKNKDPDGVEDEAETDEDTAISFNVLDNDTDPSPNDTLEIKYPPLDVDTSNTKGTVNVSNDGSVDYDPNGEFEYLKQGETATDTFKYIVTDDDTGRSDWTTVTITINGLDEEATFSVSNRQRGNEEGPVPVGYRVKLSRALDVDIDFTYNVVAPPEWANVDPEYAADASDVSNPSGVVTIPAGELDVLIDLQVVDDAIIEWNEAIFITVDPTVPPGYQIEDPNFEEYSHGILDNNWRWEQREVEPGTVSYVVHENETEIAGPGRLQADWTVQLDGNENDPMQGPNGVIEHILADFISTDPLAGLLGELVAAGQINRSFTCNSVTGDITHTPGTVGNGTGSDSNLIHELDVAVHDKWSIHNAGATRKVVTIEVAAGAGVNSVMSLSAGAGPLSVSFEGGAPEIEFENEVVELGCVKGAGNVPGYDIPESP